MDKYVIDVPFYFRSTSESIFKRPKKSAGAVC
jgi:hypothetical protein